MSYSFAQKIRIDALSKINEAKGTPIWLNQSVTFEHGLRLSEGLCPIIDVLFKGLYQGSIKKKDQKRLDLEILLANIFSYGRPIAIPFNQNYWKKTIYSRASYAVVYIAKKLAEMEYISIKIGYQTKEESKYTRIWAKEKLLELRNNYKGNVIYEPVQLVELRKRNGKKELLNFYKPNITNPIKEILEQVNSTNSNADIYYRKKKLNTSLVAVFLDNFKLYGRLHTKGKDHYQGLPKEDRKEITINGERCVELDFTALHPYLLYAKEGIQYDNDPYSVIIDNPIARPFLKLVLLYMINAKNERIAERAANFWFVKKNPDIELMHQIGITRAKPIIDEIMLKHHRIAHYLCNGRENGLKIMNFDSKIALEVIKYFGERKMPILAIHDSFIVQEKYENDLKDVMMKVYTIKTGGFNCKIK